MLKKISIIIPCYQNEGSIPVLAEKLMVLRENMSSKAEISFVLVNDGSTDNTLSELLSFKAMHGDCVKIVSLARNFGSYNAFLAGMYYSKGDCHVHLHADLQDPPELIEEMFSYYERGIKLVIANRKVREDSESVNFFATQYHLLVKRFAIKNIPDGGFDLILFDEKIREDVVAISEKDTNIVYLISWLGYPYVSIPYSRKKREHGKSQWTFWKKAKLFVDTFFSFSSIPLYFLRFMSLVAFLGAFLLSAGLLFDKPWILGVDLTHYIVVGLIIILLILGVIGVVVGEYISRIHETVRKRPNFVVDDIV